MFCPYKETFLFAFRKKRNNLVKFNFKKIHIGKLIKQKVEEFEIAESRLCDFFQCNYWDIKSMYNQESLDTACLLKWSKVLQYDFFRIYSQHLILYSPLGKSPIIKDKTTDSIPKIKKNLYTKQMIDFILEEITKGEKTIQQVISEYNIPKTTVYRWIKKYQE